MPDRIEPTQIRKFAAVYAEAVLTFLDSREAQWVMWDGHSHRFDFASVELDEPQALALLFIDAAWEKQVGDVGEITDPDSPHYDMDALRAAIEHQLVEEGVGERILKAFLERLANIDSGAEKDQDEGTSDSETDDS